jgi:hypothetical protein
MQPMAWALVFSMSLDGRIDKKELKPEGKKEKRLTGLNFGSS